MPTGVYPRPSELDRVLERIDRDGLLGCWLWTGSKSTHGYGLFRRGEQTIQAHRAVYELLVGPIPDGLDLDHLCRVRLCVNPAHLEPVTRQENVLRSLPFRRDTRTAFCAAGHPRTPENVYLRRDRPSGRNCRPCALEATRQWRKRKAA